MQRLRAVPSRQGQGGTPAALHLKAAFPASVQRRAQLGDLANYNAGRSICMGSLHLCILIAVCCWLMQPCLSTDQLWAEGSSSLRTARSCFSRSSCRLARHEATRQGRTLLSARRSTAQCCTKESEPQSSCMSDDCKGEAARVGAGGTALSEPSHRREERVTFSNARGQQLVGILFDTGSQEAVIMCHGMYDNKTAHWWPEMAETLAARGLSSLRFDFSGNGESEGEFRYGNTKMEAEDMRAAVLFLRSRNKEASALAGHSKAGSGVICYAAKYGDIPKIASISGRYDNHAGITERFGEDIFERLEKHGAVEADGQRPFTLTQEDMQDRLALDMEAEARAIPSKVHVFLIHGSEDATIPEQAAYEYAKVIKTNHLHIVQGGDHCFRGPDHRKELIEKVTDFMSR